MARFRSVYFAHGAPSPAACSQDLEKVGVSLVKGGLFMEAPIKARPHRFYGEITRKPWAVNTPFLNIELLLSAGVLPYLGKSLATVTAHKVLPYV